MKICLWIREHLNRKLMKRWFVGILIFKFILCEKPCLDLKIICWNRGSSRSYHFYKELWNIVLEVVHYCPLGWTKLSLVVNGMLLRNDFDVFTLTFLKTNFINSFSVGSTKFVRKFTLNKLFGLPVTISQNLFQIIPKLQNQWSITK